MRACVCRVSDDGPHGLTTRTGAVVRKPSRKEPAGVGAQGCRALYGDLTVAVIAAAAARAVLAAGSNRDAVLGASPTIKTARHVPVV